MPDYSLVMDGNQCIGIWLADPANARNQALLRMLAVKHSLPIESYAALFDGRFRVVPNRSDAQGGVFLMLTDAPAPGERRRTGMKEMPDQSSFVDAVKRGETCFVCLSFDDLSRAVESLTDLDLHLNPPPNDWTGLRGLCPLCTAWVDGETIGMVYAIAQMGREKLRTDPYGDLNHLLDRRCVNSSCSSREILLIWHGDTEIANQLGRHLQRMRTDLTGEGNTQWLCWIDKVEDREAISFAQDAIFGLRRRYIDSHLIVGRRCSNTIVWVSVVSGVSAALRRAFRSGYKPYFSKLLKDSGYDQGDVAVAHWISHEYQGDHTLNLGLVCDKNSLGTSAAFAALPAEILQACGC